MTIEQYIEIEKIKKVRSLYSYYYDSNDLDNLISLFTEDAVCEWDEDHGGTWVGIEEIRKQYKKWFDKFGNQYFIVMHAVTNPWIELTGPDTAKGRWFLLDLNFMVRDRNPLRTIGIYDDV
ncbi:MAG: nuclear transport factor 2 family protein [Clostridiaceae bacterium]|nr:nuclear transport factor 2 family protein [Clostridiaceae bacterium]